MLDMIGLPMKLVEIIQRIFPLNGEELTVSDKYSSFELEYYTSHPVSITNDQLTDIREFISTSDKCIISVIVESDDPISIDTSSFETKSFIEQIHEANKYYEKNERIRLKLSIQKETKNSLVHIYHFNSFLEFCEKISVVDWLDIINNDLKSNNFLKFKVLDDHFDSFWSYNIIFSNTDRPTNDLNHKFKVIKVNENCHFGNYDQYPYTPTYFQLVNRPRRNNSITNILDRLAFVYSITSTFDITSFDNNILHYKLNGYKSIEGKFNIDSDPVDSKEIYIKIFNWIYSEQSNITDKIGLSRNIISIYSNEYFPSIDESVYFSIQSGFKTYLQENINKYIEIRNKISEQLMEISSRSIVVVENYLSYYQKSNITFVTFFISVFTIRALTTQKFTDVFTKETTLISFTLLFVSAGYMIISIIGLNNEIQRLNTKYDNIKNRFKDLLVEDDINKILRDDKEFNDDISYIKNRRMQYSILWGATIIIFAILITFLSSYISQIIQAVENGQ